MLAVVNTKASCPCLRRQLPAELATGGTIVVLFCDLDPPLVELNLQLLSLTGVASLAAITHCLPQVAASTTVRPQFAGDPLHHADTCDSSTGKVGPAAATTAAHVSALLQLHCDMCTHSRSKVGPAVATTAAHVSALLQLHYNMSTHSKDKGFPAVATTVTPPSALLQPQHATLLAPRTRGFLLSQPLQHLQVPSCSRIMTSLLAPRTRGLLLSQPLQHL